MIKPPEAESYLALIELARQEDVGEGDITTQVMIAAEKVGRGKLVFREGGVLCGMGMVEQVLRVYDKELKLKGGYEDGDKIAANKVVGEITGPLRAMLTCERVVLNFLQQLSAIATVTAAYVKAVAGTGAKIYDTRKTTPGWRELEKYAVRCGGGENHRQGLYDAVLIKDNHLAGWEGKELGAVLKEVIGKIRSAERRLDFIQVEVDTSEQLRCVLGVEGVDIVLLDNFTPKQLREAVALRDEMTGKDGVQLEASGGVTLSNVRQIAETGVERISIGALTHSVSNLDIALDIENSSG